ncbi:MAG TPA: tetratricopeptide repeat protein [Gemmatimonadales bacterium]|nr:tetratricopeptide repeat protein [Gemmatimonadales bacterium]
MPATAALEALVTAGRFRDALQHYQSGTARQPAPSVDDRLLAATAAGHLGEIDLGVMLAAEAHSECAVGADREGTMRSAHLLGAFAFERGRLADAETHFEEAIRLAESMGDELQAAKTANNLASLAHLAGRTTEALQHYARALAVYRRRYLASGAAETWHNIALVERELGRHEQATQASEAAIMYARKTGDDGLIALVLAGRAEGRLARGDLAGADADLDEARIRAGQGSDVPALAEVDRVAARVALARGNAGESYELALRAWGAAGLQSHALLEADCAAACALSLKALGREQEGHGFFVHAERRLVAVGSVARAQRLAREWASG